ncbi:MAG: flagellar motor protein MotB [Oscillospiraceae bacterium]|nr:flagellar motor protein MotB [Oscillospiraceae bacterium]
MARKKKAEDDVKTDGWLTTFSDLLSLLLCFFVMMYTASVPDDARIQWIFRSFAQVAGNVVNPVEDQDDEIDGNDDATPTLIAPHITNMEGNRPGIKGDLPMTFDDMFNWVSEIVEASDLDDAITVDMYPGRMHIRIDDEIMFRAGESELLQRGRDTLTKIAPGISVMNPFIENVEVAGHTAPVPPGISPDKWNIGNPWDLSSARASSVTRFLDGSLRMVDSDKFRTSGHAGYQPYYPVTPLEQNFRNRRVELIITRNDYSPESTTNMIDRLVYDYRFPLLPGGPLDSREPTPEAIDNHQQILNALKSRHNFNDEIFESPGVPIEPEEKGREFDFVIPTLP